MVVRQTNPSKTEFLNVDLDIYSRSDLQPLVNSLGRKVIVLYVGKERRRYGAHLELCRLTKSADSTIKAFCALIRTLRKPERDLWDGATVRDFSVGVRAGKQPSACDFPIQAETLRAVSDLAARIVLTVYAPQESEPG